VEKSRGAKRPQSKNTRNRARYIIQARRGDIGPKTKARELKKVHRETSSYKAIPRKYRARHRNFKGHQGPTRGTNKAIDEQERTGENLGNHKVRAGGYKNREAEEKRGHPEAKGQDTKRKTGYREEQRVEKDEPDYPVRFGTQLGHKRVWGEWKGARQRFPGGTELKEKGGDPTQAFYPQQEERPNSQTPGKRETGARPKTRIRPQKEQWQHHKETNHGERTASRKVSQETTRKARSTQKIKRGETQKGPKRKTEDNSRDLISENKGTATKHRGGRRTAQKNKGRGNKEKERQIQGKSKRKETFIPQLPRVHYDRRKEWREQTQRKRGRRQQIERQQQEEEK